MKYYALRMPCSNLWNNKYISNIQVTSSEILGVEDRGGYYESSGAFKRYGAKSHATNGFI